MDHKKYNERMISIFDTIGSYFVDVFYNGLYSKARNRVSQGGNISITTEYKKYILNYVNGIARADLYKAEVRHLHNFYQAMSGYGETIFTDFENRILLQFIPNEYYRDFTTKRKEQTFRDIIINTVKDLADVIIEPGIYKKIIDDHLNTANVTLLQNRTVDIFILQHENYYSKFVKIAGGLSEGTVSKSVVEKLRAAYYARTQEYEKLRDDHARALHILAQVVEKLQSIEKPESRIDNSAKDSAKDIGKSRTRPILSAEIYGEKSQAKSGGESRPSAKPYQSTPNPVSKPQPKLDKPVASVLAVANKPYRSPPMPRLSNKAVKKQSLKLRSSSGSSGSSGSSEVDIPQLTDKEKAERRRELLASSSINNRSAYTAADSAESTSEEMSMQVPTNEEMSEPAPVVNILSGFDPFTILDDDPWEKLVR